MKIKEQQWRIIRVHVWVDVVMATQVMCKGLPPATEDELLALRPVLALTADCPRPHTSPTHMKNLTCALFTQYYPDLSMG
ncbi:unnamed protein product [Boreogadus saida]